MMVVLVSLLLLSSLIIVYGSHFLGGTISWHPLYESATGSPVAIVITQTYSWTYPLITCTTADIATNAFIEVGGYINLLTETLDCISNCNSGATGYVPPGVRPRCTDISAPLSTTVGQRSDVVYLSADDDFTVAFQGGAWRSLATGGGASWSIASHIKVQSRSDNGLYNNAPVATMMSPIEIPVNHPKAIIIPVGDADGDTTRCRWSTSSNGIDECSGVCPPSSLPPNTIIYPNCTIIITGQTVGNWFAVAIMVEDFISSTSTTPLSGVPVQFLVHVVNQASCTTEPVIAGIPLEDSCISIAVGQTFNSMLLAINYCGASVTIVDISTLSFPNMIKGSLVKFNTSTYYKTLSWTPTSSQLGYQVMCAMAFDSQNAQSAQYCFKFYVSQNGACACPGYICTTTTTTTSTSATTSTATTSTSVEFFCFHSRLVSLSLIFRTTTTSIQRHRPLRQLPRQRQVLQQPQHQRLRQLRRLRQQRQQPQQQRNPPRNSNLRRNSIGTIRNIRVNRVQMAQSSQRDSLLSNQPRQSIIDSTIQLDDIDKSPISLHSSSATSGQKVFVKHVTSARGPIPRRKERLPPQNTISLSLPYSISTSTMHVKHVPTSRKKLKSTKNSVRLALISEEKEKNRNPNGTNVHSRVTVERISPDKKTLPTAHL
ncbi:unnamed protein product [Rotaria sordida]|nr:unnamed protein product [Rotaria sordida]